MTYAKAMAKKYKEILWDLIFYLIFFVFGVTFVFSKPEEGRDRPLVLEDKAERIVERSSLYNAETQEGKRYVASSRGKYFYEVGTSRANSLSDKNKIYFSDPEEAKKLGFKPYFDN